jgi:hypothetical protein
VGKMGGVGFVLNAQCMFDESGGGKGLCAVFVCLVFWVCVGWGYPINTSFGAQSTHLTHTGQNRSLCAQPT